MPPMPALSSTRRQRGLLVGGEHGAAHQTLKVAALAHQRVERIEIGFHRVDGFALERQLEQRGGIAPRHAGYDRFCLATMPSS